MSEGLRPHAPYTPTQAELLDEAEKEIERLCGKVRTLERGLSEAKATISEQARDCIQARRELAGLLALLREVAARPRLNSTKGTGHANNNGWHTDHHERRSAGPS